MRWSAPQSEQYWAKPPPSPGKVRVLRGEPEKSAFQIYYLRVTPIQHSNLLYRKPFPSTRLRAIFVLQKRFNY